MITISPPRFETIQFHLEGTAPLVICKFSHKALLQMKEKQEAGSQAKKGKERAGKNFTEMYHGARHISTDGWDGIHAAAFRAAMISACRIVGFKMTLAKLGVFVEADGLDATEGTPLVRILGEPTRHEIIGRNADRGADIRVRPMYWPWAADLRVQFDASMFSAEDVANLIARVGVQVGVGEGRPDSKSSGGCGWGCFRIE
jgi:hypothetical protein